MTTLVMFQGQMIVLERVIAAVSGNLKKGGFGLRVYLDGHADDPVIEFPNQCSGTPGGLATIEEAELLVKEFYEACQHSVKVN